jgi:glycosyltransferase involved in cell wall biosynthesis
MRHRGTALVFTEHGRLSDAGPSRRRRLANQVLANAPDGVFTVSKDLKQHLAAEGFSPDRIGVIYNGIDICPPPSAADRARARQLIGASDDVFVIGTVARLDPVKDLGTLIDAAALLASTQPIRVVVIGDGPEKLRLKELAAASGITANVSFVGYRDDARDWLAGFDAYVNSSTSEGVSLTILEAMAAERPVVATGVGGTPEIVDETCGRLVSPRDPAGLAAALDAVARDAPLRESLGRAARRRVASRFTLGRMIDEYASVYRAIGGPPAR